MEFAYDRFVAWLKDPQRKPAVTAFTAGAERQAAYAVEASEILLIADAAQPVVEAVEAYFSTTPPDDEGRWEAMHDAVIAYQRKSKKRKCICPNGTRTAIAHVHGCPAGGA